VSRGSNVLSCYRSSRLTWKGGDGERSRYGLLRGCLRSTGPLRRSFAGHTSSRYSGRFAVHPSHAVHKYVRSGWRLNVCRTHNGIFIARTLPSSDRPKLPRKAPTPESEPQPGKHLPVPLLTVVLRSGLSQHTGTEQKRNADTHEVGHDFLLAALSRRYSSFSASDVPKFFGLRL